MARGTGPKVEEARPEDVEAIAELFMDSFTNDYFQRLFSPRALGLEYLKESWASFVTPAPKYSPGSPQEVKVVLIRDEQGVVSSTLLYWLFHKRDDNCLPTSRWPDARPGMNSKLLDEYNSGVTKQHEIVMGDTPHLYGEFLVTRVSARGRGYGSMLMKHACRAADALGYPFYLDALLERVTYHRMLGFVERNDIAHTSAVTIPMVRDTRRELAKL